MDRVILVLLGLGVEKTVVGKAHEGQVVFRRIASITVEMGNLADLLREVAVEVETERASPSTLGEDG